MIWGICGFKNAGKSSSGRFIDTHLRTGTHLLSFAGPLKDAVAAIYGWDRSMLEGDTEESRQWREQVDSYWSAVFNRPITPRLVLQEVGTKVFREGYHSDIWIAAVERRVQTYQQQLEHVCLTDCRFLNEMKMIKRLGGMIVWVRRKETDPWLPSALEVNLPTYKSQAWALTPEMGRGLEGHPSEISFLTEGAHLIDVIVENDGTMEDLGKQILAMVLLGQETIRLSGFRYFSS